LWHQLDFCAYGGYCPRCRWGRIIEGAGEDPFLGAAIAQAQVRGFQGVEMGSPGHVLACAKHFAGYGAADGGRDYDSAYIPEELLRNVYLPPFHSALEAGVGTFMSAYMDLNDVPATGNRFLLEQVLRREWGFRGFVVSDAAVGDLTTHGIARDRRMPRSAAHSRRQYGHGHRTYLEQRLGENGAPCPVMTKFAPSSRPRFRWVCSSIPI
jgi:beta-glucosidase-like glycosyl hydrolase